MPKALLITKQLLKLDLSQNEISEVTSSSLQECSKLTYLDLSGNPLTTLPNIYITLTNLTYLNVSKCDKLQWLPINFGQLSSLKDLLLPLEGMISPPHEIVISGSSPTLEFVRGVWQGYLTGRIKIMRTCLRQIPDEIIYSTWATLPPHCFDSMFPTGVGLLSRLSALECSTNNVQAISYAICRLRFLTQLDLSGNIVCHIPTSLHMLTNLTLLDLSKNQLHELNEALFETTSLKVLYLQENQIKIIPDSLQKLVLLARCSLAQNQLYELPQTITKLLNLTSFDVVRNVIVFYLRRLFIIECRTHNL
jgi:internalin A